MGIVIQLWKVPVGVIVYHRAMFTVIFRVRVRVRVKAEVRVRSSVEERVLCKSQCFRGAVRLNLQAHLADPITRA